jgi:hypothetical protein
MSIRLLCTLDLVDGQDVSLQALGAGIDIWNLRWFDGGWNMVESELECTGRSPFR